MFTGIITYLGKISSKTNRSLAITADSVFLLKITKGTSVSINGICLTVTQTGKRYFKVDLMPETEKRTNIKYLQSGILVNLELPATPTTFLSGHIVQGHVDGIAKLISSTKQGNSLILKLSIPTQLSKYIVEKGPIALNGISLTVINKGKNFFTVGIIPFTWENTCLHTIKQNDFLNLEVDILAKYIEGLLRK